METFYLTEDCGQNGDSCSDLGAVSAGKLEDAKKPPLEPWNGLSGDEKAEVAKPFFDISSRLFGSGDHGVLSGVGKVEGKNDLVSSSRDGVLVD